MVTSVSSLKSILHPATGKERLHVLLKLCGMPSYWGEADELPYLQEADLLAIKNGSIDEQAKTSYLLGIYHLRKANYAQATIAFNQAQTLYEKANNTKGIVDSLVKLAAVEHIRSNFEIALHAIEPVIVLATKNSYNKGLADALHIKAITLQSLGNLPEAMEHCIKALDIYEMAADIYGMGVSYFYLGSIYDSLSNYVESLSNLSFALKIREDISDRFGIAETLNQIGIVHWKQSNHLEGTKQLLRALKIEEETGDKFGMATSYNVIGNINSNLGNYDEALKYYRLTQDICKLLDRKKGLASSYYNIGIIHYELGDYDTALENHFSALNISKEIAHKELTSASYNYLGKIYATLGKFDEALNYQQQALALGLALGDKRRIGIAYTGLGSTYERLGSYALAKENLYHALSLGKELSERTIIKDALFTLVEVYKKSGDFEQALDYFGQYHQLQNEISNETVQKQLTTLNFQHSMEVKEKESALLKEKNEEIQRYLHKLEISNNELKQFAHVAAHDLREPLRMISSYITLLEQSIGGNLNEAQKKFIGFAIDGSKRMEVLIEDMLRLAKVDADPKIEKIELTAIINEIKLNLSALMTEKGSQITIDELPAITADRTQILQLFQNIIGNGMKYNESIEPTITIKHSIKNNELHLTIADNGIGIPKESREKAFQIFQRVPTAKKYSGSGIGLAICKKIVDNLNGKIWIEDNAGGGSVFNITFPNILSAQL